MKRICIISSLKYAGKIKDDLIIKEYFSNYFFCEIVPWEKLTDEAIELYDIFIIRSVWGYHKRWQEFINCIKRIEILGKILLNKFLIVEENIQKIKQYNLLKDHSIAVIPSIFVTKDDLLKNNWNIYNKIKNESVFSTNCQVVIKPNISASGDDTKIIKLGNWEKEINDYLDLIENENQYYIIQPYWESVAEEEMDCVIINNKFQYCIYRKSGVFINEKKFEYNEKPSLGLLKFLNNIIKELKHEDINFYRLDVVKNNDKYYVLELEATDPDLFIKRVPIHIQKNVLRNLYTLIKKLK